MPDFTIKGDPGAITAKVATMRQNATTFTSVAEGLESVTTDGWTGRAADRFREKFDAEPDRWRDAGDGFRRAADGLATYAGELTTAQSRADWARDEHARGDQVTREARAAYDADVSRAQGEAAQARAAGQQFTLTILPFEDPGEPIRQGALSELASARRDLEEAGAQAAREVRAGCAAAPEKRNWFESGAAFVGGVFAGAGEAIWELGEMVYNISIGPQVDLMRVAVGDLTPEELAMKNQLKLEQAQALLEALEDDPVGFGKNVGKAILDWDNWADDPANALGRLIPDVVATVASGGAGASVRALRGLEGLHDISLLARPMHGLRSLGGMDLHGLTGLSKLDDASLASRIDALSPADQARLLRRGEDMSPGTMSDVFGPHKFDADYSRTDVAESWAGDHTSHAAVPHEGPLMNVHARGDAGSGMYWTDPAEGLAMRSEGDALDRLALRDEWYMDRDAAGDVTSYTPRDEITVRDFHDGDAMRMEHGQIGPQDRAPDAPLTNPETGGPVPEVRPGGADQYVMGLDEPFYSGGSASQWTGPAPWVEAVPDGAWGGFAAGAGAGAVTSGVAGAGASEAGR